MSGQPSAAGPGTEQPPPPTTPPPPPADTPPPQPETAGIREAVAAALGSLLHSGKARVGDTTTPATAPERDIAAEVRTEVGKIQTRAQRDSEVAALKTEVEALKAATQKAPIQERRVERIMGWRRGEDA